MSVDANGPKPAAPDAELEALRTATHDLFYPSESDSPIVPFRWPATTDVSAEAEVKTRTGATGVQKQSPERFFAELEGTSDAARFRNLRKTVGVLVRDAMVFRAGEVNVQIVLIGKSRDGSWLGVQTTSVQT